MNKKTITRRCPQCHKNFMFADRNYREMVCPTCQIPLVGVPSGRLRKVVKTCMSWAVLLALCAAALWVAKRHYPHETIERVLKIADTLGLPPVNAVRVFAHVGPATYHESIGGVRYAVPKGFYRTRTASDEASFWVEYGPGAFAEVHLFFYDNAQGQSVTEFAQQNIQKGTESLAESLADVVHIPAGEFMTRDGQSGVKAIWKCTPSTGRPYYRIIYYIDMAPDILAIGTKVGGDTSPSFEATLDRMATSMRRDESIPAGEDADITPLYGANLGDSKTLWRITQTYWQDGNASLAIRYLTLAANQGFAEAQYALGLQYFNGKGVPQNASLAIAWYERAAQKKNVNALSALGYCYQQGMGATVDLEKAKAYYTEAAALGDIRAKRELDAMQLQEPLPERSTDNQFTNPFPPRSEKAKGIGFDPSQRTLRKGEPVKQSSGK